jgi:beta-galactosidase
LLQDLKVVANWEDPTRPTIAATCTDKLPQMNQIPDLLGWNIYPGWYPEWGPLSGLGPSLERYGATSRQGGYCVSEYGAGANVTQHEENPKEPKASGQWHPEEWQGIVHEEAWAQMKRRPYIWGTFLWNMFDFVSYWRHEGGVQGRNDKGLITFDRKTKKDAFYFYKANWSDEGVLYITDREIHRAHQCERGCEDLFERGQCRTTGKRKIAGHAAERRQRRFQVEGRSIGLRRKSRGGSSEAGW